MILTFTQDHRVMRNPELFSHSVVMWYAVAHFIIIVDYNREMNARIPVSPEIEEYGSFYFEHMLFGEKQLVSLWR